MNPHAYRIEAELGFSYCADGRGREPFVPIVDGREVAVPQLPGTLPTLDELLGVDGCTGDNVHDVLLAQTKAPRDHVFTLHAELEGAKLMPAFTRLLDGWRAQGYELCSTLDYFRSLDVARLPRCAVAMGEIPGRSGTLAIQA
jgi:peptidoglycan/xylan/chitin deacetylase (PgdA/CDA1 family)